MHTHAPGEKRPRHSHTRRRNRQFCAVLRRLRSGVVQAKFAERSRARRRCCPRRDVSRHVRGKRSRWADAGWLSAIHSPWCAWASSNSSWSRSCCCTPGALARACRRRLGQPAAARRVTRGDSRDHDPRFRIHWLPPAAQKPRGSTWFQSGSSMLPPVCAAVGELGQNEGALRGVRAQRAVFSRSSHLYDSI